MTTLFRYTVFLFFRRAAALAGGSLLTACLTFSSVAVAGVACPIQKLQSAINTAPAGQLATFTFTGTCSENVVVPYGKNIALVGATSNSRIIPRDASRPAVSSYGSTEIRLATVTSEGSANLVEALAGGRISIVASTLKSSTVNSLLKVSGNSYASIINSELNGGTWAAINVLEGSTVVASGDSGATLHSVNGKKTIVTSVSPATLFYCVTSTVHISLAGSASVKLTGGNAAIIPSQCRIGIYNGTSPSANIELSNFSGSALGGSMSTYDIQGLTIKNSQYGILSQTTSFQIGSAIFSGNSVSDIMVGGTSTISIPGYGGYEKTQFKDAVNGAGKFNCFSGARIDIKQDAVVQDLSSSANNCVTIY